MSGGYLVLLWVLCGVVFVTDWLFRRVPNRLLLVVLAAYVVLRVADWAGLPAGTAIDLQSSLVGGVLAFVFLLPFYAFRAMGAGDVKYFAVLGLLMGPAGVLVVWLAGTALTGVHAVMQWIYASEAVPALANLGRVAGSWMDGGGGRLQRLATWIHDKRQGRRGIPYAAYMAIAAVAQPWISARL
ncbi:prepilin peptidase [Pigmentiphaga aceris]|uniref:Prepilin peptidase n=1 Tax=Pigmentiphaga aceris TaxID=1940612 RepID=A0A5C0AXT2_9BURK|nr:prepilin peptidase [Pigmentiphaga aceris]QEI05640.1 prepilin peptidase [Pigmentiphaga aceris]